MKAYISISYSKRHELTEELNTIIAVLKDAAIDPFVFIDNFKFSADEENEMMQQAMISIEECDILIAEVTDKAIGVGVEVGYAKARKKPVIYIKNKNAEHSTTVSGISDLQILYQDVYNLKEQFKKALAKLLQ
jgi:nucleoside 2-deoxyribosyltransferase